MNDERGLDSEFRYLANFARVSANLCIFCASRAPCDTFCVAARGLVVAASFEPMLAT